MAEEHLLEFLYVAPVGLLKFDQEGNILMANPQVAQLLNRFSDVGYFQNFLAFTDDVIPTLSDEIRAMGDKAGSVTDNARYCVTAPSGDQQEEELWFDITVNKLNDNTYMASVNNVTAQVKALGD